MKKLFKGLGMAVMLTGIVGTISSCGGGAGGETGGKTIEVLVQTADHGWTGAVQSYAKEKVDELNKAGKYKVNLTACESATIEANKIDDLLARKDSLHGIVLLPIDNTLEAAVTKIAKANVPFVQFDRVITTTAIENAPSRVANVLGDNYGIGVATAKRFIKDGITPADASKVIIFPGDNSSVPVSRNNGFFDTLKKDGGWSDADIKKITMTDYTGWSRVKARELLVSQGDKMTGFNWIFTHDSEIAMGILEELKGNNISKAVKDHFLNGGIKSLASSSGLDEMYAVLEDKHTGNYKENYSDKMDLFDVTYDPAMIKTAISDLVDHIEGKKVEKNHVIPVSVVDKTNVNQFKGFGSGNYRK